MAISLTSRVLDVLLVWASGALAYALRFGLDAFPVPVLYDALILIGGLLVAVLFPMMGVYHSWRARGLWAPVGRVMGGWIVAFLALMTLLVVSKEGETFSRLWLGYWGFSAMFMLMGLRFVAYAWLRSLRARGYNRRRAVVVGCGPHAKTLIEQSRAALWAGFDVPAVFAGQQSVEICEGLPVYTLDKLADFVEREAVDEVWVAIPLDHSDKLLSILECLRCSTVTVRYAPDLFGLFLLNHGVTEILNVPMIDLTASPMQGENRLLKGMEDRILSVLILLLISPLMVVIAIGVKLSSPGPILFRQRRHGWDGREIEVWKFRSMRLHRDDGVVAQAKRDDPRVTAFGAFLRRTSLDELPQFINVLQGRMSIVGPRPHAVEHNQQFRELVDHYMLRHKVKPGITGWAQINGWRGETDTVDKMKKRIEHDLYYIENWSLAFDLKIIFLTLLRGFVHKNAY